MNFKDINASSNPLFKDNDIIKLDDIVKIKNVIFIHDYVNKSLPLCFQSDFLKLDDAYTSVRTLGLAVFSFLDVDPPSMVFVPLPKNVFLVGMNLVNCSIAT